MTGQQDVAQIMQQNQLLMQQLRDVKVRAFDAETAADFMQQNLNGLRQEAMILGALIVQNCNEEVRKNMATAAPSFADFLVPSQAAIEEPQE